MKHRKMDYYTYEQRLAYLEELAGKGRLLSIDQIVKMFDCSERTARRMLATLRRKGVEIEYSHLFKKFVIKNRQAR